MSYNAAENSTLGLKKVFKKGTFIIYSVINGIPGIIDKRILSGLEASFYLNIPHVLRKVLSTEV